MLIIDTVFLTVVPLKDYSRLDVSRVDWMYIQPFQLWCGRRRWSASGAKHANWPNAPTL